MSEYAEFQVTQDDFDAFTPDAWRSWLRTSGAWVTLAIPLFFPGLRP